MSRAGRGVLAAGFVLSSLVGCGEDAPTPDTTPSDGVAPAATVLTGATIIVGDGTVIERGTIVVVDGTIAGVGPAGQVPLPDGARVVDLTGRTVIPGLVDAHAHLGYEAYTGWGAEHYSRENLVSHLERYAYYGFSAVFSAGSDPADLALAIQDGQAAGDIGGARLVFAAGMAPPGQGPNQQFLVHTRAVEQRTGQPVVRGVATPDDARRAVQEAAALGIGFIKIWVDDRGGSQDKLPPELYRPILDASSEANLRVFAHQQAVEDMPGLLAAGVDGFLHGRLGPDIDEEMADRIAGAGAFVVPNLGLGLVRGEPVGADPFFAEAVPASVAERLGGGQAYTPRPIEPEREAALGEALLRLRDAGVDILLGTDAGAVPDHFFGYAGHRELELFVRLGLSPMEALVSATSVPAARLGLNDLGLIAVGRNADLVVLQDSPLDDIRNTRTILDVYQGGLPIDRARMRAAWQTGP